MGEEIKNLSDEELGKRLAEISEIEVVQKSESGEVSSVCPVRPRSLYCEDLNLIAEVETVVVAAKGLGREYADFLEDVIYRDKSLKTFSPTRWDLICATARQRAEACLLALQEKL